MGSMGEPLKMIIVGAGLGGCATALAMHHAGFSVAIYEKARKFQRLGDSLGLGENALLLLERWSPGLRDRLVEIGNKSQLMQIQRWEDGKILAQQELMDMAGFIGHHGDYHEVFLNAVREKGMPINMGVTVQVVQFEYIAPSITLPNGEMHSADIIIAADGVKSRARELVLGFDDKPKSSGYACFRTYFKGAHLKDDPLCAPFVTQECVNVWIGRDVDLVQNTLRDGDEFNWILTHKNTTDIRESWYLPGDVDEVRRIIATCDPRIVAAVAKTKECLDWRICYSEPIPSWVSANDTITLLRDSCHPHLPTTCARCQSGDGECCGIGRMKFIGWENVPLAKRVYEKLRFPRVRLSQTNSEDLRDRWHRVLNDVDDGVEIDPGSVKIRNRWLYDLDAEADTRE